MEFQSKVESLSYKGLGVVRHENGKIFYVEGVWPGDSGLFKIIKEKKSYGFAEILKIETKSPDRRESPCKFQKQESNKCGGCSWMIANYDSQIKHKIEILKSLARHSKFNVDNLIEKIIIDKEFNYKNRAQLHFENNHLGFHTKATNNIVDIDECMILNSKTQGQLSYLRKNLEEIKSQKVYLDDRLEKEEVLTKFLGFNQGNSAINHLIKKQIEKNLKKHKKGIELFCGSGNYSEVIIKSLDTLRAYDYRISDSSSIENTTFIKANIHDVKFPDTLKKSFDFLFLDPPRAGAKNLAHIISGMDKLKTIYYLSCDPSTMFRDITTLKRFEIIKIIPFDAYPQTPHLEVLTILHRK